MRQSWPVDAHPERYLALRKSDLRAHEQALAPGAAWRIVERLVQHPADSRQLLALEDAIGKHGHLATYVHLPSLQKAFLSGQWVLLVRNTHAPSLPLAAGADAVADQIKKAKEVKTWVEFEVFDADGKPCASLRYRCMLPDGSMQEGSLDAKGRARYDGIDAGNCCFELVDLENDCWERRA